MNIKRHSQDTAVNHRWVVSPDGVRISRCCDCRVLAALVCSDTGEAIPYPASGPVGERCTLKRAEELE